MATIASVTKTIRIMLISVVGFIAGAGGVKAEEIVDVPLNCTIPGELELENTTKNNLMKYQRLEVDSTPKASFIFPSDSLEPSTLLESSKPSN